MTNISWTEQTWNPIVGCSIASKGCKNCYAMKMATRLEAMGVAHYAGTTQKVNGNSVWTGKLVQAPECVLMKPLKRKKPTMYFVNSMSDLFHEDIPDEWIDQVFAVMALSHQHTFQILTKRAKRMYEYFTEPRRNFLHAPVSWWIQDYMDKIIGKETYEPKIPLSNVWLGVSAEDQEQADLRIPNLIKTPAKLRFLSLEPQLEEISLTSPKWRGTNCNTTDWLDDIQWIIQGCESGPKARYFNPDWARSIRNQCFNHTDMGRPWARKYFLKQLPGYGYGDPKIIKEPLLEGVQHLAMPGGV